MHQYKTVAKVLLILSIFNLAFTAPVVREMFDAHDNAVVPVVVRNVAALSKERRSSGSEGPTPSPESPPPPDGSTSSHPSPPPPDGSTALHGSSPSDVSLHESPSLPGGSAALEVSSAPGGTASLPVVPASDKPVPVDSTSSHSLPQSPDGSMPLHGSSPSDGSLHESPSHPGGPAALEVSSPPDGTGSSPVVPASDQPVPVDSTSSHSLPQSPDGSMPLHGSSPSGESLHESPSHPGGPAALDVSSPPGGTGSSPVVPASDHPVLEHSTSTAPHYTPVSYDMLHRERPPPMSKMKFIGAVGTLVAFQAAVLSFPIYMLWHYRHDFRRRTIGHDCSTANGSPHPCLDYQLKDHLQD